MGSTRGAGSFPRWPEAEALELANEILAVGAETVGILIEKSPQELGFPHRVFQEFLAARFLSTLPFDDQERKVSELFASAQWHDVLLCLCHLNRRTGEVDQLVNAVVKIPLPPELEPARQIFLAEVAFGDLHCSASVAGIDSAHKLAILVALAYGTPVNVKDVYTEGITHITPLDIAYAKEFGCTIKLLGIAKLVGNEVEARVHPTMLPSSSPIAQVEGVYNAIQLVGDAVGDVVLYGRGAGSMPGAGKTGAGCQGRKTGFRRRETGFGI